MYWKNYKPITSGIRFKKRVYWNKVKQIKRLIVKISSRYRVGRDGKQLLKTCGRGNQCKCRIIDWYRYYELVKIQLVLQYSKQNSSGLELNQIFNKSYSYYNLSETKIKSSKMFFVKDIKERTFISNAELYPGEGIQLIRSAGTQGQVMTWKKHGKKCIKLPSWKIVDIDNLCRVLIGRNYNKIYKKINYSKAGTMRHLGKRIYVRGVAMNAVDHPHGGKSGPSRASVSPWGWITK